MAIFKKIKYRIRLGLLRRSLKLPRVNRQVMGYDQARTMVLFYDMPPDATDHFIVRLIGQLKSDGKKVHDAGFINIASIPQDGKLPMHLNVFCKKDFRWNLRPRPMYLKDMLIKEYDILLDISSRAAWPMKQMAAASRAKYKVGANHPDYNAIYDLIIKVDDQCPGEELAKHAIHYLKIIKTPTPND